MLLLNFWRNKFCLSDLYRECRVGNYFPIAFQIVYKTKDSFPIFYSDPFPIFPSPIMGKYDLGNGFPAKLLHSLVFPADNLFLEQKDGAWLFYFNNFLHRIDVYQRLRTAYFHNASYFRDNTPRIKFQAT
jgi:hypothetical protein